MARSTLIAFGLVIVAIAAAIILLVTGGGASAGADDTQGDVRVSKGTDKPEKLAMADIRSATAARDGSDLVLEVEMDDSLPRELTKEALSWRWEIYESGQMTWLVSATVDLEPNVSVLATQTDYQASSTGDPFPGDIELSGSTVTVRLRSDEIDGFPGSFDWLVKTSLDGDRIETASAVASDRVPDDGYLRVDG